jgi:hypothetical protein
VTQLTARVGDALEARMRRAGGELASPVRRSRTAVVLGRLLGAAFVVCFVTGLYSHFLQDPLPGMVFLTRPVWIYQLTQGVHVTVGIALVPLLLGKLWSVYHRLFEWPPIRGPLHLVERGLIGLLVATALLEPAIGLVNTYQWYPWPFPFRQTHFALAWLLVGALAVHVGVKLPIIVQHWSRRERPRPDRPPADRPAIEGQDADISV